MPNDQDNLSFELALDHLEAAVADLEAGNLDLDHALARYEQAVRLVARCRTFLDQAEKRVALITGFNPDGSPATSPFEPTPAPDGTTSP